MAGNSRICWTCSPSTTCRDCRSPICRRTAPACPFRAIGKGGLSGSPCYAASNERIKQVYREYGDRFAIAGIGGVFTPQQAYEKIRCGSSLVMFISALMYRGPQQITVLKRGLAELLRRDGFEHVSEAVGIDA